MVCEACPLRSPQVARVTGQLDVGDLSPREAEIAGLVGQGFSNREIGKALHIAAPTVKYHMRNVYAKTDAPSRVLLALWAVKRGLVELE